MRRRPITMLITALALVLGPVSLAAEPSGATAAGDGLQWRKLAGQDHPPQRAADAVVFDSANNRLVAVVPGSFEEGLDTWVREGTTWREIETADAPSHRMMYMRGLAYDAAREEVVLFGGEQCDGCDSFTDTWIFDGENWEQRSPAASPPYSRSRMVYDPVREQVVLFGGNHVEAGTLTWTWDGSTWTEHDTAVRPHDDLNLFAMAWDESRQAVVLHGGFWSEDGQWVYSRDTWAWDGSAWAKVAKGPRIYRHTVATYGDHVVLVGGSRADHELSADTWLLGPTGWTKLDLARHPAPSDATSALTPVGRNRLLLTQTGAGTDLGHWVLRPDRRS